MCKLARPRSFVGWFSGLIVAVWGILLLQMAAYLWAVNQGLGQAVEVACCVVLLCTGVAIQRLLKPLRHHRLFIFGALALLAGGGSLVVSGYRAGALTPLRAPTLGTERAALQAIVEVVASLPAPVVQGRAFPATPCRFEASPPNRVVSIAAHFVGASPSGAVQSLCVQADSFSRAIAQLRAGLRVRGLRGAVKLDIVAGQQRLDGTAAWADAYKLRPGLDGLCLGEVCAMPWQLVAAGVFEGVAPSSFFPHLLFGARLEAVASLVGRSSELRLAGLTRITTRSYLLEPHRESGLVPLRQLRPSRVAVSREQVVVAAALAEQYLLESQTGSGALRYAIGPYSGLVDRSTLSIPRQAGALWALCSHGEDSAALRRVARRLGEYLLRFRRRVGGWDVYTPTPNSARAHLGYSSLVLLGLTSCSLRFGWQWPAEAIAQGAGTLLRLQRAGGQFAPWLDLKTLAPAAGPEPLYAGGQAVLALLNLEVLKQKQSARSPSGGLELSVAIERAMTYAADHSWDHPLRDYFYLEENWHCLAAAAASQGHRNDRYEQFCLDYVSFKTRFVLGPEDGVDPALDGGFGFGNLVVPNTVAAAGLAEALGAAIRVAARRGMVERERHLSATLRRVVGFLVSRQWTAPSCFACEAKWVVGGFSESLQSSQVRVDFVQHALSALRVSEEVVWW